MKILLATKNKGKVKELAELIAQSGISSPGLQSGKVKQVRAFYL